MEKVCECIAASPWWGFWKVHLSGKSHWSHIKYKQNRRSDGHMELTLCAKPASFFLVLRYSEAIPTFRKRIWHSSMLLSSTFTCTHETSERLKRSPLTGSSRTFALPTRNSRLVFSLRPQTSGAFCTRQCSWIHEPAKYDEGLPFFTAMAANEQEFLWARLPVWKECKMPDVDLAGASEEWIQAIV